MQSPRDENRLPAISGLDSIGGEAVYPAWIDPATGRLLVTVVTGTPTVLVASGPAPRDQNHVPAMLGVSDADGVTPVPVMCDPDGNLLVDILYE